MITHIEYILHHVKRIKSYNQIIVMAELFWNGQCFACRAPLDIIIMCDNNKVFDFIDEHVDMQIFDNNDMKYKFFGQKARKICKACFDNYYEMKKYKNIRNIEYSKFPRLKDSMSQCEVKAWFDVLKKSWFSYNK